GLWWPARHRVLRSARPALHHWATALRKQGHPRAGTAALALRPLARHPETSAGHRRPPPLPERKAADTARAEGRGSGTAKEKKRGPHLSSPRGEDGRRRARRVESAARGREHRRWERGGREQWLLT